MSGRHAARAAAVACALALGAAPTGTAQAAQVSLQPTPAEARSFATTDGGWSSAVDYGGLVCIPGVTCPSANPGHQSTGGAGGAGDGFLRDSFGTLLGVLSTTTVSWTSPSFVAPASTDVASLSVDVRPQIASLLAIGSVRLGMRLVDVADGTRTTTVADVPLTTAASSFSTVSANVPPGALVAGRSYSVQFDAALTTSVSAVTSGNVDLDDAVLRLTDLEPPAGLTGSFQTGVGGSRVTGTVDPLGQTTSVTVEYGPTAAYGSATSPVTVTGSGAQPFTVPLTSLTPGATYHYRLVAQNADGTTTTSDQTLTAPSPPTDAAPAVSGAGNSRTRTVTFDRPADVAGATVEVLDAARTVVGSFADDDGDGVVTITLPDADASYGVRVVRVNGDRAQSTSAAVPAMLDRIAPSAGPAPTVTGQPDALTVTFTRAPDAVAATVELLDANGNIVATVPVPSGSQATVALPAELGLYAIQVVQSDAAGNSATTPPTAASRPRATDGGGSPGSGAPGTGSGGPSGPSGAGDGAGALPLPDPGGYGALLTRCFGGDVVLTDVTARGARVSVRGLSRFAPGTAVTIVDLAGRTVGRTTVSRAGSFVTRVRAPRSRRARRAGGYRAVVGSTRSPVVRLRRANVLTGVSVSGATVTVRGRVDLARLGRLKRLRVYGGAGAAACRRSARLTVVGKVAVDRRTGVYRVRVRAPTGGGRLVLRTQALGTKLTSRSAFAVT